MVLRAEGLRTLRAREIYTWLLLPALLGVPVLLAGITLVRSLVDVPPRVAIPLEEPPGLEVGAALAARKIVVIASPDPASMLEAGTADAAILRWVEGSGIGEPQFEPWRWRADLAGGDAALQDQVRAAVREAGDDALEGWVQLAGGDPARELWVADIRMMPAETKDRAAHLSRMLVSYLVFAIGLLGVMMVVGGTASERAEGVMESVLSTAAPPWAWLLARAALITLIQCVAAMLLLTSLSLTIQGLGVTLPWPPWLLLRLLAAFSLLNHLLLLVGVAATDVRIALGAGSYVLLGAGALLGWGVFGAPVGVPMAGLISAEGDGEMALALGSAMAAAALLFAATLQAQALLMRRGRL